MSKCGEVKKPEGWVCQATGTHTHHLARVGAVVESWLNEDNRFAVQEDRGVTTGTIVGGAQPSSTATNNQDHVLPVLPYNGSSGWSGSDTSKARADHDDASGKTTKRQQEVLDCLTSAGRGGLTWSELAQAKGWHHGQASGPLSVLHKVGKIARLTEEREGSQVYVLPEHVDGRETAAHRSNKANS